MDLQKNLDRVRHMIFDICSCNNEEAKIIIETFLKEIDLTKEQQKEIREKRYKEYEDYLNKIYSNNIIL